MNCVVPTRCTFFFVASADLAGGMVDQLISIFPLNGSRGSAIHVFDVEIAEHVQNTSLSDHFWSSDVEKLHGALREAHFQVKIF